MIEIPITRFGPAVGPPSTGSEHPKRQAKSKHAAAATLMDAGAVMVVMGGASLHHGKAETSTLHPDL
jgi:hypothetical protein